MRIPLWQIIASQTLFWSICVSCGTIAWKFYNSVDGMVRLLQIDLFLSLSWCFGVAGAYYILWDFSLIGDYPAIFIRLICNAPLAFVIIKYLRYFGK